MTTFTQNPLVGFSLAIIALLLSGYSLYSLYKLNSLRKAFFKGPNGEGLEPVLKNLSENLERIQKQQLEDHEYMSSVRKQLEFAIQYVGMVRYNPFNEGGGNFSFSVALLNEHKTGVIITSLYGRQQNRMYAKNISQGKSESTLTEEEEQSLKQAIG